MQRNLGAAASQQMTSGTTYPAVLAMEVRKRSKESAGIGVAKVSGVFDGSGKFRCGRKRVDMATAPCEPAVQAIAERRSVGHGYVESAGGLQDSSNFGQRAPQIAEVLQTVVGYDGVERPVREGKVHGVGLR